MEVQTVSNHPFKGGLKEVPEGRQKDMLKIKAWMATQPHIPAMSDDFIYLFLHACYYSHEKTKSAIENYCTIRSSNPAIFGDRNFYSPRMKLMMSLAYLVRLPKTTPEGYRVLLYSVRDNDPTKMNFSDAIKGFCMYNDLVLSEDGLQEGYIVVFDMKGVQLGHLARVSLPALRCFMSYIQEGHPCRLKSIHILNTASWIHHVMRLVVPLIKSELLNLLKFHKGNAPEGIDTELLPAEYGGEAGKMEDLDKETKTLVFKYHKWLIETEQFKSDESKRIKKASWWSIFGSSRSNTEELDEKTILKNLQVD